MYYRINVEFTIISEKDELNHISQELGTHPSREWRKGDRISKLSTILYKVNGWVISSGLPDTAELDDHISCLKEIINKNYDKFRSVCSKYESELSISICVYNENEDEEHITPAINFDKSFIKLLGDLNSDIDIDLYVLNSK